jgi:hypothetical protein
VNNAGGVLGKPLEILTEDDQTTNPGAIGARYQRNRKFDSDCLPEGYRRSQHLAHLPRVQPHQSQMM